MPLGSELAEGGTNVPVSPELLGPCSSAAAPSSLGAVMNTLLPALIIFMTSHDS